MALLRPSTPEVPVRVRLCFALTLVLAAFAMLGAASSAQASPGALRILVDANEPDTVPTLTPAIAAMPGVATVDLFNTSAGTPSAAALASYDLVVNTGDDVYAEPVLYGDRLADYLDAGGSLVQFAYDNWNDADAFPRGRFESGGYAPFVPGPNPNAPVSLGAILVPGSPFLANVPNFTTSDNTTDEVAPGATLLAKWSDGRNAIATKGRVVSVTASPQPDVFTPLSAAAQLVVNTGNVFHPLTGQQAAALKKCKKRFHKTHNKKRFKKCRRKAHRLPL
jgi:hypothetical protein